MASIVVVVTLVFDHGQQREGPTGDRRRLRSRRSERVLRPCQALPGRRAAAEHGAGTARRAGGGVQPRPVGRVRQRQQRRRDARREADPALGLKTGWLPTVGHGRLRQRQPRRAASGGAPRRAGDADRDARRCSDLCTPRPRSAAPGSPPVVTPSSLAGTYTLSPRSTCFGGTFVLVGGGSRYRASANGMPLGSILYVRNSGNLGGDVGCLHGGSVRLRASASGITLSNVRAIPLQVAHPAATASPSGRPVLTTVTGLAPSGEQFTAVRTRSFDREVAAFFIAVAIVMLFARLLGLAFERDPPAARDGRGDRRDRPRPDGARRSVAAARVPDLRQRHPHDVWNSRQPRLDLLHVPDRARHRYERSARAHRSSGSDLEHERRAADDARPWRGDPALSAARAAHEVRRVRPLHGRLDVRHGLPGACADPRRAAHHQAADRHAGD